MVAEESRRKCLTDRDDVGMPNAPPALDGRKGCIVHDLEIWSPSEDD
jgi:hypothetical protein